MSTWSWGRHPTLEALRSGKAKRVFLARGRRHADILDEIRAEAGRQGVPIEEVAGEWIEARARGQNTQGVGALVEAAGAHSIHDLLEAAVAPAFFLALDQIQDPHNIGALMRTADAAGVQGVIMPERRAASLTEVVARSSAGAVHHLAIARVPNLARALDTIKQAGIWIVGLDGSAEQTVFDIDLTTPTALVVGSEGDGLRRLTRERCDYVARLPMRGNVSSLNASVAGGIAMYEVLRQRIRAERA